MMRWRDEVTDGGKRQLVPKADDLQKEFVSYEVKDPQCL